VARWRDASAVHGADRAASTRTSYAPPAFGTSAFHWPGTSLRTSSTPSRRTTVLPVSWPKYPTALPACAGVESEYSGRMPVNQLSYHSSVPVDGPIGAAFHRSVYRPGRYGPRRAPCSPPHRSEALSLDSLRNSCDQATLPGEKYSVRDSGRVNRSGDTQPLTRRSART
jgi:hypothetical protein